MAGPQPLDVGGRFHAHLRLSRALRPGRRRSRARSGGPPRHPDHSSHGAKLREQAEELRERHGRRSRVLGVDPDLVAVIEYNREVPLRALENEGLNVLGWLPGKTLASFASDPELTDFIERCRAFEAQPPDGQASPRHMALFDAIEDVRGLMPADVIDAEVSALPLVRDGAVVGAGGTRPDRLLAADVGTSFAAPLVSHAAATVLGAYPNLSANAVKALVLCSVQPASPVFEGSTASALAARGRHPDDIGGLRPR